MYPYDDMPGGANQAFKPRPTQFGGNSSGMAGINSMVSALSGIQDRYNQFKRMHQPGQPMVNGQPWQPAPREGSPNLFQGAPNMGPQSGMPSAPPTSIMPPTQTGMAAPLSISPPQMPPSSPVPFQGMGGPGMGLPMGDGRVSGFLGNLFGAADKIMSGQKPSNPFTALMTSPPQG